MAVAAALTVLLLWLSPSVGAQVTFTHPTTVLAGNSSSLAVGYFNDDLDPDLVVANPLSDDVSLLLGGDGGSFGAPTRFAAGDAPSSVVAGDFNSDSRGDIAVASSRSNDVTVRLGGDGSFGPPTSYPVGASPSSIAAGYLNTRAPDDGDDDLDLDLVVANSGSDDVSVLLGDGSGSFGPASNFPAGDGPSSVAVGNFDRDDDSDLAVAERTSGRFSVSLNKGVAGNATFGASDWWTTSAGEARFVAVGDFSDDSDPDLAVLDNDLGVLFGSGGGLDGSEILFPLGVSDGAGANPTSLAVADLSGDGRDDVALTNGPPYKVSVNVGDPGNGGLLPGTDIQLPGAPRFVAAGNFDGDDDNDLAVAGSYGVAVTLNTTPRVPAVATPPETIVISGPSGRTTDPTATFLFRSSKAGSRFQCSMDTGTTFRCSSPFTSPSLAFGVHTFRVRATDHEGNTDATPAQRVFSVVPTLAQVRNALGINAGVATRALRKRGIAMLGRKRGVTVSGFDVLVGGYLSMKVTASGRVPRQGRGATRRVVIAKGGRTVASGGRYSVRISPTRAGRVFLRGARRVNATLSLRFRYDLGTASASRKLVLKRLAGSRRRRLSVALAADTRESRRGPPDE